MVCCNDIHFAKRLRYALLSLLGLLSSFRIGPHIGRYISFVDVKGGNILLKAGKKVESYRNRWVFMDAHEVNPLLLTPTTLPTQSPGWGHQMLTDPRAQPVLARIAAHGDAKLTGAMIVKEFLGQRITTLQACSRHLWEVARMRDQMRLHVAGLVTGELEGAMMALLGFIPVTPPI
jgi:hypothetical protein